METTQETSKTTENYISERLSQIWPLLSHNQRRFVIASLDEPNKKAAAEAIGIEPQTVYRWPEIVDEAIELVSQNTKLTAISIIAQSVAKAAMIKANGLDSDDEKIRQAVATEILDRQIGKPVVKSENINFDMSQLTTDQLQRIANGEDPIAVITSAGNS